jgi:carboxyl-terminal processing protease
MTLKNRKKSVVVGVALLIFLATTAYKNNYFEIAKQVEIFATLFKEINMNYVDETVPAELMQEGIKSMLASLDPYTNYISEQEVESARINQSSAYVGIGATLNALENKLVVIEVFKGLPADEAGLKPGDEIVSIANTKVSVLKEAAQQFLDGKKNSFVALSFVRNGLEKSIKVKRKGLAPKAVPISKMLKDDIGYIALDRFSKTAAREVENALKLLVIDEAKGVILDLRNNPGGLLQEAVKIVNLFIPKNQLVVSTKSNIEGYNKEFKTVLQPVDLEIPLVILINENSASASEIVAGALQDLDRAIVVGERSFGKGLVQRPKALPYGGQLKVTISRYYTPSGRCIQALDYRNRKEGVALRFAEEDYTAFKTKGGRTVFDGGGITPDVLGKNKKRVDFIKELIKGPLVFEFANNYFYNNKVENLSQFALKAKDFKKFKEMSLKSTLFLKDESFEYLKELTNSIKNNNLEGLDAVLLDLGKSISDSKLELMDQYEKELLTALEKEIVKRYFYREGVYEYNLMKSKDVSRAIQLLNAPKEYLAILKR